MEVHLWHYHNDCVGGLRKTMENLRIACDGEPQNSLCHDLSLNRALPV
jgi:hypothetical protein